MDPLGRFLFVSGWQEGGGNLVSSYRRSSTDGTLTLVGDYPTGGGNPAGVAVTPDGRFVYVVNYLSGTISGFSIAAGTGVLTAVTGSPFTIGAGLWELAIDPSGRYLYAGQAEFMTSYAIDLTSGVLRPLRTPLPVRAANASVGATVVVEAPQ
jgi:DNA-binding beta-propeller fold protein YncE